MKRPDPTLFHPNIANRYSGKKRRRVKRAPFECAENETWARDSIKRGLIANVTADAIHWQNDMKEISNVNS